jgi:DNA-binding Lrp family transcriptional regulator
MTARKNIDEIDKSLISILQKNARTSYREIKEKLGISIGTIHNRITNLKERKIILGNTVVLNDRKVGYPLTGLFHIQLKNGKINEVITELKKDKSIISIFQSSGTFPIFFICKFKNLDRYGDFVNEMDKNPLIKKIVSNVGIKQYKHKLNVDIVGKWEEGD